MNEITVGDYTVSCGGETVFGRLYVPADGDRFPAVIISHGYNGRHLDWVKEGTYLAEHGIAAYAFDFAAAPWKPQVPEAQRT